MSNLCPCLVRDEIDLCKLTGEPPMDSDDCIESPITCEHLIELANNPRGKHAQNLNSLYRKTAVEFYKGLNLLQE